MSWRCKYVEDSNGGVLISLAELLSRIDIPDVSSWVLYDFYVIGNDLFACKGVDLDTATRRDIGGLALSPVEFASGIHGESQLIDGEMIGLDEHGEPIIKIICVDGSLYEIWTPA